LGLVWETSRYPVDSLLDYVCYQPLQFLAGQKHRSDFGWHRSNDYSSTGFAHVGLE
jgi:hypothetical protein